METCLSGLRYLFAKEAGALYPLASSNLAVSAKINNLFFWQNIFCAVFKLFGNSHRYIQ